MTGSRLKTAIKLILISLVGLAVGIAISFYIALRISVPITEGEVRLIGIEHPAEITFDSMGICQIWAETETDACFALGYQHAADRMFQMDLSRRLAAGRLSEMLGSITQDIDISQRRIGHNRLAMKAMERLSEPNRQRLQAYADGVNAYNEYCRALPFEYRFLPVKFEDWTVLDCLTLLSFQTWFSNALMDRDDFYLELAEKVGEEKARSLAFYYPDWAPTTVPPREKIGGPGPTQSPSGYRPPEGPKRRSTASSASVYSPFQRALTEGLFSDNSMPLSMTHSSNAWAVAPQKSASGAAMLASDPHLEITRLPQFWYAAGIHVKKDSLEVLGISTPGLPFFVMGHNGKAAWGFTAAGIDVNQQFVEQINPDDSNQYWTGDSWRDFDMIHDSIYVADIDSFVHVNFRCTETGPVLDESDNGDVVQSIFWVGFESDLSAAVGSGFDLHRVQTFEQFQKVVTNFGALDVNMLYADISGNIGYQLTTPLKVLPFEPTTFAAERQIRQESSAYGPLVTTPQSLNPSQGWLASCNNLPRRFPPLKGHFFANRIVSITELLSSQDSFTVEDMQRFQMDKTDRYLARFKDELAIALDSIDQSELASAIRAWDGSMTADSKEAALMNIFLSQLKQLTFEDELDELYYQVPAKWIEGFATVERAGWFDDVSTPDVVETFHDIAVNAAEEAIVAVNGAVWGDIHSLSMAHPLGRIPILGGLLGLTRGPDRWEGTSGTLCASFNRETSDGKYECMAGPSWRFVIDFANIDSATMVLPAGNSGNPMSDHFFDFYEMYKTGQRWTVPFSYDKVKERAVSTLVLSPTSIE